MTKKKKILNGVIFLVGLIVFVIYYFKDNTDMEKVEKKQDASAEKAADSMSNALNEIEFDEVDFEVDSAMIEEDSIALDSL